MAQQPQRSTIPKFEYVDLTDLRETYADYVQATAFDGQSVKITFAVTRFEGQEGQSTPSRKRYTACRLVLPVAAAAALSEQLNKLGASIAQAQAARDAGPKVAGTASLAEQLDKLSASIAARDGRPKNK